jgi:hypothetical protein
VLLKYSGGKFALQWSKHHRATRIPRQNELHRPVAEAAESVVKQYPHPATSQKHNDPAVLWAPTGTMVLAD